MKISYVCIGIYNLEYSGYFIVKVVIVCNVFNNFFFFYIYNGFGYDILVIYKVIVMFIYVKVKKFKLNFLL